MKEAILIAGPTASGKSAFAIKLANDLNGVIINADSMQVYKDLRVLTARPSLEEEAQAPHRLYGVLDGAAVCSAADWAAMAMAEVEQCHAAGQMPILVGGTGMYFRFLVEPSAPIPEIDPTIRQHIRSALDAEGSQQLHKELAKVDAATAARLAAGDSQRIARALEVFQSTGKPISWWQQRNQPGPLSGHCEERHIHKFVLNTERSHLYDRCNLRFDLMLKDGALEEARALLARDLDGALPLVKALGYPSLARFLQGDLSLEDAVEEGKMLTRRFAKRQMTWFRNQFGHWKSLDTQHLESLCGDILKYMNKNG